MNEPQLVLPITVLKAVASCVRVLPALSLKVPLLVLLTIEHVLEFEVPAAS